MSEETLHEIVVGHMYQYKKSYLGRHVATDYPKDIDFVKDNYLLAMTSTTLLQNDFLARYHLNPSNNTHANPRSYDPVTGSVRSLYVNGAQNMKYLDQEPWGTDMPYSMLEGFKKEEPYWHALGVAGDALFDIPKLTLIPVFAKTLEKRTKFGKKVLVSRTYWKCSLSLWEQNTNFNENALPKFVWIRPEWIEPFTDATYKEDFHARLRATCKRILGK